MTPNSTPDRPATRRAAWITGLTAACLFGAACQPAPIAGGEEGSRPALLADNAAQPGADGAGCEVGVESIWIDQETPLRRYTTEARTLGQTCDIAIAVLTVRAREGTPVFVWAGATRHTFGLKDAPDAVAMKAALAEWIDQSRSMYPTSDLLPAWPEGAESPDAGEFPFYPESWIDRTYWETLRGKSSEVFCFPQGMESMLCAVLHDGALETIGVQTFPG